MCLLGWGISSLSSCSDSLGVTLQNQIRTFSVFAQNQSLDQQKFWGKKQRPTSFVCPLKISPLMKCVENARKPIQRSSLSYLVGGHVTDRAVGLDGFQLVQTPVQLLHRLHGQFLVRLICQQAASTQRHTVRTDGAHGA